MDKADGAFLTIGELARELGVAQHILRYWETRFPQLRPLQRAGNRRYYRPQDVSVARQIHRLLTVEGFTIKGAGKALAMRSGVPVEPAPALVEPLSEQAGAPHALQAAFAPPSLVPTDFLDRLIDVRRALAMALDVDGAD